ncbi:MAG TPA: L,D-transpeptidase [Nocardioidaceae bacterium]|nr:L,D-transpeptidase [Nocardioidaceae bacterium]
MRPRLRRALATLSTVAFAAYAVGTGVGAAGTAGAAEHDSRRSWLHPVLAMVDNATRAVDERVAAAPNTSTRPPERLPRRSAEPDVPARSGQSRRVVFDISAQRVWLVRKDGTALRTYLVSGSKHDNLSPGHYEVYSRSRHATSYTYVETMEYMVRFTHGENAAIGFHDIPVGPRDEPVQTHAQLGQPLSAGCIRQRHRDAKALWNFAPVGTDVVVIA